MVGVVVVMVVVMWVVVKEEAQVVFHRGKMETVVCFCRSFVNSSRCVMFARCFIVVSVFLVITREVELEVKRSRSTKIRSS